MKIKLVGIFLLAIVVLPSCSPLRNTHETQQPQEMDLTTTSVAMTETEASNLSPLSTKNSTIVETTLPSLTATKTATKTLTPTPSPSPEPTLGVGSIMVNPIDNAQLLYVPEGEFTMGGIEELEHKVWLDAFWVYQTEVTNAQFATFVDDTGYVTKAEELGWSMLWNASTSSGTSWRSPEGPYTNIDGKEDYPVVHISWDDAKAYCKWAGGRLPTEAEWEKAARGTDKRTFPWGEDAVTGQKANFCDVNCTVTGADRNEDDGYAGIAPVGTYPEGASPYGALDMAGNVWEWVSDLYSWNYYNKSPYKNPPGPTAEESESSRCERGGSWYNVESYMRASRRGRNNPDATDFISGFRCIRSPKR